MILLLDTSTGTCKLSVDNGEYLRTYEWQADRELAKGLLAFIKDCLADNNAEMKDISGIGVMAGPGSFTGLRIGLTVANTLAASLGVPIVGYMGEDWEKQALRALAAGENQEIVMPEYGNQPNITKPRK